MGDVCEEVSGNNGNVKGLPILTISAANGWMNQKDRFSQVIAGNELKKYTLLEKGHLAYNHGNSKLAKYGTVFVQNLYDQALVPRVYHSFKMKTENNPYYVEYYFATKKLDRELARLVTSGARMDGLLNINKKDFFKIKFKVPIPVEQSLISTILQKLDQTITLHEEKQRQLERLKKALLEKMFRDETGYPILRFKGFNNVWKQRKLGEVSSLRGRIGFRGYKQTDLVEKGKGAITFSPSDIDANGNISFLNNKYISIRKYEESPEIQVNTGDILFTKTASIGKIGYVKKLNEKATINPQIALLTPKIDFNGYFIFLSIRNDVFMRKVQKIVGGSSVPTMSQEKLKNLAINFPSSIEQHKLATIFLKIDGLITLHQHKIDNLKHLKCALLQKMFV